MRKIIFCVILTTVLISCNSEKKETNTLENVEEQKKYSNPRDEFVQFDTIKDEPILYKDSIASWKGYHQVKEILARLENNTPNEVLNTSEELVNKVVLMRDSLEIDLLKKRGVKARINALYNQSLRLQEMAEIPSITIPEIKKQTQGLFVIFRMLNRKVNAIYQQQDFEDKLLLDNLVFSKLDSIQ